jgi:sorting and assembly machinery component 37
MLSGQLPFLTHEHRVISPLPSIVKYVATVTKHGSRGNTVVDPDSGLNNIEKAQRVAWYAHGESNLGDLLVRQPDFFANIFP